MLGGGSAREAISAKPEAEVLFGNTRQPMATRLGGFVADQTAFWNGKRSDLSLNFMDRAYSVGLNGLPSIVSLASGRCIASCRNNTLMASFVVP